MPEEFHANLMETIGVPYEIISIDNSQNKYSIFEAYNLGIKKSKFAYLCFIHDDILFKTSNWGQILINYFIEDEKLGIVGVAGSTQKTKAPSSWWINGKDAIVMNITENLPNNIIRHVYEGWQEGEKLKTTVVVDGVFMGIRKDSNIYFNTLIGGFHNYDQSICLDYLNNGYKVCVTKEILLEHFSAGKVDAKWIMPTHIFHKLYEKKLPASVGNVVPKELEIENTKNFIIFCFDHKFKKVAFYYWQKYLLMEPFTKLHLTFLKRMFE